jgi:hypothetical protein
MAAQTPKILCAYLRLAAARGTGGWVPALELEEAIEQDSRNNCGRHCRPHAIHARHATTMASSICALGAALVTSAGIAGNTSALVNRRSD